MGIRYRKTIKIAPGVKLNISKSGISTSFGTKGATVNVSKRGTRATVGLPGTGISYSSYVPKGRKNKDQERILREQRRQVMRQYHLTSRQMSRLEKKLQKHPEAFVGKTEDEIIRMVKPLQRSQPKKKHGFGFYALCVGVILLFCILSQSK